jgi:NAD(P)-dependent dehydrogenase (short-subunit alcohol dehydrogenase family)
MGQRVCVVTGAAGGIGSEIARQLLDSGARVALLDREIQGLQRLQDQWGTSPDQCIALQADVTDVDSVQKATDAVRAKWGSCSVLVNNAAALYADAVMDIAVDKWKRLLDVNLTGYLLVAQALGRLMMKQGGGSMIHIASIAGTVPQPWSGAYSVSKAGVKMLSQQLALELGEFGIRSNVVSPAMIRTPMSEVIYQDPSVLRKREAMVPAGRISTPADIAQTVLFLASDRASYISGQELLVDGGLSQTWLGLIPRPGFEKQDALNA